MSREAQALRRRAAVAVLSDLLEDSTLLQELWLQHDSMRGESVSDIIEYVDAVAARHAFDAATTKRLYADFFKAIRLPDSSLPLDPWPAMQALRPPPAPVAPAASVQHLPGAGVPGGVPQALAAAMVMPGVPVFAAPLQSMVSPVASPLVAASMPPQATGLAPDMSVQPQAAAPQARQALAPEPAIVFGAVVRTVVDELVRFHRGALDEVRNDALRALAGSPAPASLREQFGKAWTRAEQHDWRLQAPPADLAEMTRVVHQALQMAFGRVGADQILQRAVEAAEALPEARRFSPKRLLAAM